MSEKQATDTQAGAVNRSDSMDKNSRPRNLIHSVSIFVETVHDDSDFPAVVDEDSAAEEKASESLAAGELSHGTEPVGERQQFARTERHQSSPIIYLEDHLTGKIMKSL
jgi:hypothetical protein